MLSKVVKPIGNYHAVNAYFGTDVMPMLVWTVHWISTDNCTKGQCRGGIQDTCICCG